MITNEELQSQLKQYPNDLPIGFAVNFNGSISLFYDVQAQGVQINDMQIVLINCPDVDLEYETLMNGAEINDEELYGEYEYDTQ